MKLENADLSSLFSNTVIPDIFFAEYLSEASGEYIKVYLYMVFLSKYDKEIKINDLSKKLVLPVKTIQDSIKYWEDQGLITKKSTGYIMNSIQEIELHKLYKPKTALSAEQLQKSADNQKRAKAIEFINNKYFSGLMPTTWYPEIELWFKKYHFDEEVMIALFGYCFDKSALHKNYVQTVAEAWNNNNIKNFNDLDKYYEKQEKLKLIAKTISKKLGLSRALTQYEYAYIEKWNIDFGFGLDIIEIALKKTTSKVNPNFDYLDKLLTDWHTRGFKTADAVQAFLLEIKEKNKNIKKLEKQTGYDKYEQRTYDNLDNLYANLKL